MKWIKYTKTDLDETPLFVVKLGEGEDEVQPYPEEFQKMPQLQYENMKTGELVNDIEYPLHEEWCYRLRIIEANEKDTYRKLLGKWAVKDFVGVQWDASAKDCNPPQSRGKKVTFRPIMERE